MTPCCDACQGAVIDVGGKRYCTECDAQTLRQLFDGLIRERDEARAFWGRKCEAKKMSAKMRRRCAALERRIAKIEQSHELTKKSRQVFGED